MTALLCEATGLFAPWAGGSWIGWIFFGLVAGGIAFSIIGGLAYILVWAERRGAGRIQHRRGPNRVGPWGLLQSLADTLKLLSKEDLVPRAADAVLFVLAPAVVMASALGAFTALPFSRDGVAADMPLGIYLIMAMLALSVIGVVMAGWASNNKWSVLGAMREAAQMIAYEIPIGLLVLSAVVWYGSLNLGVMAEKQAGGWLNVGHWFVFHNPLFAIPGFLIFYISILAMTKRLPFDLPEGESELVAGFMTEYSGMRWSFFFMEEYGAMFITSAVAVLIFLGGWNLPFVPGEWLTGSFFGQLVAAGVMFGKALVLVLVMIWIRWTWPRLRVDQVTALCYKYLTPLAFVCLLGTCLWKYAFRM